MSTAVTVSKIPNCDVCPPTDKQPAAVDARTRNGQWAYLCDTHWRKYAAYPIGPNDAPALGTGIGQRLILAT